MNKKDLNALGIEDEELVKQIIILHGKDIENLKGTINTNTDSLTALETQLEAANQTIKGFQDMDIDAIKETAKNWQETAEKAKQEAQVEMSRLKKEFAIDKALISAKAKNPKAVKALLNTDTLELDEEGNLKGFDEILQPVMEKDSYLFEGEEQTPQIVIGSKGNDKVADSVINAARNGAKLDN